MEELIEYGIFRAVRFFEFRSSDCAPCLVNRCEFPHDNYPELLPRWDFS